MIEEGETEESDLEEVERHEDTQDFLISAPTFPSSLRVQIFLFGAIRLGQEGPGPVNFKLKKGDGQSALDSSNSGSSDEEQEAEQTNGPKKVPWPKYWNLPFLQGPAKPINLSPPLH